MSIDRITFKQGPSIQHSLIIVISDNLEPEIIKEIFDDYLDSIRWALSITNAPITFKAEPQKLTDPSVAKIFNAFIKLIDAKYTNTNAQKTADDEKCDDESKIAKSENSIYFSNDLQAAKVKFEDAKKSTSIDIEFNDHF